MMILIAIVILAGSFMLSLALTRLMIVVAPKLGLIDHPGKRRIHDTPIPRAGGIAIWVTFISVAGVFLYDRDGPGEMDWTWYLGFALTSGFLVAVGVIDDRWGLSAWLKLICHVAAAVVLFFTRGVEGGLFLGFEIPWYVHLGLWVVWMVFLINAFNLIDGMDGLCAGLASIALLSLTFMAFYYHRSGDGIIILIMLGALLGFLRYNFHPARIFLGDAGSMLIGFFVASAATTSVGERLTLLSLLLPIVVAGVPLLDVLLAVWRRSFRSWLGRLGSGPGGKVFGADQHHLHHRLLAYGLNQRKATSILYGLAVLGSVVAIVPSLFDERAVGLTFAALVAIGLVGFRYLAPVELGISGEVLKVVIKRPAGNKLFRAGLTVYDGVALGVSVVAAFLLEHNGIIESSEWGRDLETTAVTMACGLLMLTAGKGYLRRWSRASVRDFLGVLSWFGLGMFIAGTINVILSSDLMGTIRIQLTASFLGGLLICVPRGAFPVMREMVVDSLHRRAGKSSEQRKRVVVYGSGSIGELFLNHVKITAESHFSKYRIIGFLDDHPELYGKYLDGFKIRGDLSALPDLVEDWNLHGVVVTINHIEEERLEEIREACRLLNLVCYRWNPDLEMVLIDLEKEEESE
ncbi:MAG: hypothetical protein ACSHYF_10115 [Verrucomicrobiaceae bacterium]